jgi:eukaryotic-like serine/threonine-protein kinase
MTVSRTPPGWSFDQTLGSGSFADVYQATEISSNRKAAVKMAPLSSFDQIQRLETESEVLNLLSNVGVLGVPKRLDDVTDDGHRFLLMTVAPGTTLRQALTNKLEAGSRFGDVEALEIGQKLLLIIHNMHTKAHLVHRDIKDSNVLITPTQVTLIDFGFTKMIDSESRMSDDSFWRRGPILATRKAGASCEK